MKIETSNALRLGVLWSKGPMNPRTFIPWVRHLLNTWHFIRAARACCHFMPTQRFTRRIYYGSMGVGSFAADHVLGLDLGHYTDFECIHWLQSHLTGRGWHRSQKFQSPGKTLLTVGFRDAYIRGVASRALYRERL